MRGFVVATLALVVLQVAVGDQASRRIEQGGGLVVGFLRRLLSPDVAGVPQLSGRGD